MIPHFWRFVKGFFEIFSIFFVGVVAPSLNFSYIIPQANRKVNTFFKKSFRQIAQIREKDQAKVCAICLLTFCVGCGIMEIRPVASDNGPPKFVQIAQKERGRGFPPPLVVYLEITSKRKK